MGAGRRPYFEAQAMSVAVTVVLRCCPLWLLLSALAAGQCGDGSCSATCLPGKPQYSFCWFCSLEPLPLQHFPRVYLTMKFILPHRSIGKRAVHVLCGTRRLALDCSEVSLYYYASGYGLGGSEYISVSEIVWKFDFQRSTSDNRFLEIAYLSII